MTTTIMITWSAFTSDNGVSTPQDYASLLRWASNTNTWDFPDVIKFHVTVHTTENDASLLERAPNTDSAFPDVMKFRVAVHTLWEKAIRFRHPDYYPDRAQKLISSSMSRHLSTCNILSKSMHLFLSILAHRRTDRQTNKRERGGENIYLLRYRR